MADLLALGECFLDLFFPRKCVGCSVDGAWICEKCRVVGAVWSEDGVVALYSLEEKVIREAMHTLKYNGVFEIADVLVDMTAKWARIEDLFPVGAVLVPVPTSVKRERERGYNQAGLLADAFGKWAGLEVVSDVLVKRNVKTQVGKNAEEREASLAGAFQVVPGEMLEVLKRKPVVLIDDVYTTGSTVRAVRRVLVEAGVSDVRVVVVARAGS